LFILRTITKTANLLLLVALIFVSPFVGAFVGAQIGTLLPTGSPLCGRPTMFGCNNATNLFAFLGLIFAVYAVRKNAKDEAEKDLAKKEKGLEPKK
jgi:positive regulator of sigma E activity